MVKNKDSIKDIFVSGVYLNGFVLFLLVLVVPYTLLLGGGGAEDQVNLSKFMFYGVTAVISVLFLFIIKLVRLYVTDKNWLPWFDVFIHDPEKGVFAKTKNFPIFKQLYRINQSIFLSILFGLLLFIPFVFTGSYLQQTAVEGSVVNTFFPQTAFPEGGFFTEQQVTETADFGLSIYPASPTETLFQLAILCLVLLIAGYVSYILGWLPRESFVIVKWFVAPLISAGSHLVDHLFRYGGQEFSLASVFLFGLVTAYLFVITASLVIPLVYHDVNNAIYKLFSVGVLGSDESIGVIVLIWILLFMLLITFYRRFYSKKEVLDYPTS